MNCHDCCIELEVGLSAREKGRIATLVGPVPSRKT